MTFDRSALMSRIRGKHTSPERILRSALWRRGLRYRLHARTPVGRPDVVFPGPKVAVFVDGCFWHGCPAHYVRPRSNDPFWSGKLRENVGRDRRQTNELEALGWRVVRIWEHRIFEDLPAVLVEIENAVEGRAAGTAPSWRVVRVEPLDEAGRFERQTLEDLRDPGTVMVREQPRTTAKWKIPAEPPVMVGEKRVGRYRSGRRRPATRRS